MKQFKNFIMEMELLLMGGNVIVTNSDGIDIPAEKIDLNKFDRKSITKNMVDAFLELNKLFEKKFNFPIWKNKSILTSGFAFNGSAESFFTQTISDDEFKSVKPKVGDIDLTVPEELKKELWELLNDIKGMQITKYVKYIGNNRPLYSERSSQINSVFEYSDGKNSANIQVDFELTPYFEDKPSEFTKFAHSSNWNDMKHGLKGVHHKLLLRAIAAGASIRDDIIVITPKATFEKPRIKKLHATPTMLKFSVDRGVRIAYEQQFKPDGSIWKINGKLVYREIPTKESKYEQNLENIFKLFFGELKSDVELKQLWSFVGVLKLMKKYFTKKQIEMIFFRLLDLYWGPGSQGFERNNPELDLSIKRSAYNKFLEEFPWLKKNSDIAEKRIEKYYKNYRMVKVNI